MPLDDVGVYRPTGAFGSDVGPCAPVVLTSLELTRFLVRTERCFTNKATSAAVSLAGHWVHPAIVEILHVLVAWAILTSRLLISAFGTD